MRILFRKSLERDLERLRGQEQVLARLRQVIEQLEAAETLAEIANARRMQGWSSYYRVRIGDYRLGLKLEEDVVIVLRFLHRREIHRRFP